MSELAHSIDVAAIAPIVAGPFVGSFLGVLATRLPKGQRVAGGRSRCAGCGRTLGPSELVPIVSYAVQRGRCRGCAAPIDPLLPAIEIGAALVPVWAMLVPAGPPVWASALLGWTLLALAAIDMRSLLLPDALTLPLVAVGLACAAAAVPDRVEADLIGAAAGALAFAAVRTAYRRLRGRDGLGLGDVKLLAALGAWVGWDGLPSVVLLGAAAAIAGVLVAGLRGTRLAGDLTLPFGAALCLGGWLVWLYGPISLG
jgi:leader peptidase (prepilin peptidase)/N-methyltransferase